MSATWTAAAASERGSAHTEGVGNQDAVGSRTVTVGGATSVLLVAVSDGHGGRRYVRSQAGSRLAVTAGLDALEDAVRSCDVLGMDDTSAAARRSGLDRALRAAAADATLRWRAAVLTHLASTPFTEAERVSAGNALDRDPLTAYGSTLLFCLASGDWLGFAQLGDGDVVVRTRGTSRSPVPGDERLVAGATTSLCLPDPISDFRYAVLAPEDEIDLVLLATDGYGNAFASDKWRDDVVADIGAHVERNGHPSLAAELPGWLSESARIGGDDVTVAVLVRQRTQAGAMVTAPQQRPAVAGVRVPVSPTLQVPRTPTPQGGRRTKVFIAMIIAAVVLGIATALAVLARSNQPVVPPAPSQTVEPLQVPSPLPRPPSTVRPAVPKPAPAVPAVPSQRASQGPATPGAPSGPATRVVEGPR